LIEKARKEDRRERLYALWCGCYPYFDSKSFISFEEFVEKNTPQEIEKDTRSFEEIMNVVKAVEKELR